MDYGVCITKGVQPWQILQQDKKGTATLELEGTYRLGCLSADVPIVFSEVEERPVTVKARIVSEDTGEPVVDWHTCVLLNDHRWKVKMVVPKGGLYRVETYMEYEGWGGLSVTRGDMVHHIGVGDVYLIAGQSNAAGRSKNPINDAPELGVHMLRLNGQWDLATHPLTETTGTKYPGNYENHNPGHSPWIHFAKYLKRELNYPIGLVNTSYGGSPLSWWNPEENGALLDNTLALLRDTDTHIKGVLWYQGEAEGYEKKAENYEARFAAFVKHLRSELNSPYLPVITVQVSRCTQASNDDLDREWGMVREAQRQAAKKIPNVYVVPSNDLALYDSIHISSESNIIVAERCAKAALCEIYGRSILYRGCEVAKAHKTGDKDVKLYFDGISNWLNAFEAPAEQLPFDLQDENGLHHPISAEIGRDTITLHFKDTIGKFAVLHGAWRTGINGVVPWDCMRMPMLSFYGMPVEQEGKAK